MILDDIRNLRVLSEYQLEYIKTLDEPEKQKIIEEYNKIIDAYGGILTTS